MTVLVMTGGGLMTLGIVLLIRELVPGRPRLDAAAARLEGTAVRLPKMRVWLARLPVPYDDLALVGISVERFHLQRIGYAALGLALPFMLNVFVALPWVVPGVVGLASGAVFGIAPDLAVRSQAVKRREEFRAALSTYLDLVALERAAGAAPTQALQAPADICNGWVFERIVAVLDQSRRAGEQPWQGLAALGKKLGVAELTELADIAEDAGVEGAQVLNTLLAKAHSMRTASLTDSRAQANSRTSDMPVAIATTVIGFMVLVCFPAAYRIFYS